MTAVFSSRASARWTQGNGWWEQRTGKEGSFHLVLPIPCTLLLTLQVFQFILTSTIQEISIGTFFCMQKSWGLETLGNQPKGTQPLGQNWNWPPVSLTPEPGLFLWHWASQPEVQKRPRQCHTSDTGTYSKLPPEWSSLSWVISCICI